MTAVLHGDVIGRNRVAGCMSPCFKPYLALFAAFVVCFVVVCPFTPTPTALGKTMLFVALVIAALPVVLKPPVATPRISATTPVALLGEDPLELTCVRLC